MNSCNFFTRYSLIAVLISVSLWLESSIIGFKETCDKNSKQLVKIFLCFGCSQKETYKKSVRFVGFLNRSAVSKISIKNLHRVYAGVKIQKPSSSPFHLRPFWRGTALCKTAGHSRPVLGTLHNEAWLSRPECKTAPQKFLKKSKHF